ncbi:phage major capsid protein [Weissella cibaria]|uniref:phage major capsid protein n=1 Tax=Weissella cibaria TaxID=137591 RepID=UPI001969EE92|nr:phage major capsid protein [Weissella cibaria]
MNIADSIEQKKAELVEAIEATQALIDDPDSTADDSAEAMAKVKQIQKDIEDLQKLQEATPEQEKTEDKTDEPAQDESEDSSTPDAGSSVSEENTEDDAPADESAKDNTDETDAPADGDDEKKKDEERSMPVEIKDKEQKVEARDAFNAFMRTKGEKRDGLTSTDAAVVIPESIIYDPTLELETVVDLAAMVTKTKVSTGSGKYPILKRPSAVMASVAELEENPTLAKPQFDNVNWDVETYRGAIPVSQESLDDAQVDLGSLVAGHIQTLKVNTTNAKIAGALSTFTAKSFPAAGLVDGLKGVVNVDLDPAYSKSFVMTQSMFDTLDKVKDGEGRYLLQDQIGTATGKTLFGLPVAVIGDTQFASTDVAGTQKAWVGDLRRAVLFADRADIAVEWVRNEIYGRILEGVLRFDVEKADADAGYMVTIAAQEA